MRPCDQCGTPVGNDVEICKQCEDYNAEHGCQMPHSARRETVVHSPEEGDRKEEEFDRLLLNVFYVVCMLASALIGLDQFGWYGFLWGGLIGGLVAGFFLRLFAF